MPPAVTLDEVIEALEPHPLRSDELDDFFVETAKGRDPVINRRRKIIDRLEKGETHTKILLAGHPGCGKSTELVKLRSEIDPRFVVVQLSAIEDGHPNNNPIEAVLVLIVEAVLKVLSDIDIKIPEERIESIEQWFAKTFEISESELEYSSELGGGVDARDSVWARLVGLTAVLKAGIRLGSTRLSKNVREHEQRLTELSQRCRDLIWDAQLELRDCGKELLLIFEDLDKAQITEATALFIDNPTPLGNLPLKAIFTAPILLLSNPRIIGHKRYFVVETIPMIKVEDRSGNRFDAGWEIVEQILAERIDLSKDLIARDAIELAIGKTGGVLHHLFEALGHAATAADQAVRYGDREAERITREDVRYGLNRVRGLLIGRITAVSLPEEFRDIRTADLYRRLDQLRGKTERVEPDLVNLILLQAHALVEYNGEQWHRVHPLVEEHLKARSAPDLVTDRVT